MKILEIEIVRNDGQVLRCGGDNEWGILSIKGIDGADVEVFRQDKGYGNGSIITGKRAADREMIFCCEAKNGIYGNEESRRRITGFFSIENTYVVNITLNGIKRKTPVPCECTSITVPTENLKSRSAKFEVILLCPEPYLAGAETIVKNVSDTTAAFGFPVMHTANNTNYTTGFFSVGNLKSIYYNGTAPAPLIIELTAKAAAEQLIVTLNRADGKAVVFTIVETIAQGDFFFIDTRQSIVRRNNADMRVETYLESVGALKELMLSYGDNSFSFADGDGNKNYDGSISYNAEYNGV